MKESLSYYIFIALPITPLVAFGLFTCTYLVSWLIDIFGLVDGEKLIDYLDRKKGFFVTPHYWIGCYLLSVIFLYIYG